MKDIPEIFPVDLDPRSQTYKKYCICPEQGFLLRCPLFEVHYHEIRNGSNKSWVWKQPLWLWAGNLFLFLLGVIGIGVYFFLINVHIKTSGLFNPDIGSATMIFVSLWIGVLQGVFVAESIKGTRFKRYHKI